MEIEIREIVEELEELKERVETLEEHAYDKEEKKNSSLRALKAEITKFLQRQWDASNSPIALRSISAVFNRKAKRVTGSSSVEPLIDLSAWSEGILKKGGGRIYWPKDVQLPPERRDKLATISFEDFQVALDDPEQDTFMKECNERNIGNMEAIHRFIAKKNGKSFVPLRAKYDTFEEEEKERRNPTPVVVRTSKEEIERALRGD